MSGMSNDTTSTMSGTMSETEVHLIVEGHCIETEAKKVFNKLVNYLLKNEDPEKEKEFELLRKFLETADFNKLRSQGLDGRERKHVVLRGNGKIEVIEVKED